MKLIKGALDGKLYTSNTSGIRGVRQDSSTGHWIAFITFKKKQYYLGTYTEKADAAKVRKKAEEVLYGEFLEYYESELKQKHQEEIEKIQEKYIGEMRAFAAKVKNQSSE